MLCPCRHHFYSTFLTTENSGGNKEEWHFTVAATLHLDRASTELAIAAEEIFATNVRPDDGLQRHTFAPFFAQIRKKKSVAYNSAARAPTIILIAFVNVVIFALSTLTNRA